MPRVSEAPTESTSGSYAGLFSRGWSVPLFPPATTTTIPARQAFSTAWVSGSRIRSCTPSVPYDRLITRIGFFGSSLRCATTQSTAAMTCETSTAPSVVATLMLVRRAPGATPRRPGCSSDPGSLPAMIPAMCVPWPNVSR